MRGRKFVTLLVLFFAGLYINTISKNVQEIIIMKWENVKKAEHFTWLKQDERLHDAKRPIKQALVKY
ncbi:hypothetical protein QQ008_06290 [Fulvivirgaceae bacterium BMA10]|uniref:Uncharacterized protein n=1 Tax=Splendidivirga corallicola TaxID=3051826 RepID=A0ABT8KMN2_9BACT|nr:hypothetical protein [Fulvivirgaceae bacterium BMA10]